MVSSNMNGFKEMFKALSHVTKSISSCKFHNKNKSTLTMNMKEGNEIFLNTQGGLLIPPRRK